jgi:hypothetical protein
VDTPFHRLTSGNLTGVVRDASLPSVSFRALWTGGFQSGFEQWFEQELTFRPAIVRTANTLNLLVFGEISGHADIPIVLGEKNTLFEMNNIDDANGVMLQSGYVPPQSPYTVQESARRLGLAARNLRARNIDFLVVFYPHKAWMEPELVSPRFRLLGGREKAAAGYGHLLAALSENGVPVIDGVDVVSRLHEAEPELPLYNRGGTHWTYAAACSVAQVMVKGITGRPALRRTEQSPLLCKLGRSELARGTDVDIAQLSNLWDISPFRDFIPTVRPRLSGRIAGGPPSTLVIGTSFSQHLIDLLQRAGAIKNVKYFEYYRHPRASELDWRGDVAHRGLIVLEQSQGSSLTANTSEFVDDLLREL